MTKQSQKSSKKKAESKKVFYSSRDIIRMGIMLLSDTGFWTFKPMAYFSEEDAELLLRTIFFKPKNIRMKEYHRIRKDGKMNFRRKLFIHNYIAARGNGAKAARLSGYSPRTARQIAYNLLHNC